MQMSLILFLIFLIMIEDHWVIYYNRQQNRLCYTHLLSSKILIKSYAYFHCNWIEYCRLVVSDAGNEQSDHDNGLSRLAPGCHHALQQRSRHFSLFLMT